MALGHANVRTPRRPVRRLILRLNHHCNTALRAAAAAAGAAGAAAAAAAAAGAAAARVHRWQVLGREAGQVEGELKGIAEVQQAVLPPG